MWICDFHPRFARTHTFYYSIKITLFLRFFSTVCMNVWIKIHSGGASSLSLSLLHAPQQMSKTLFKSFNSISIFRVQFSFGGFFFRIHGITAFSWLFFLAVIIEPSLIAPFYERFILFFLFSSCIHENVNPFGVCCISLCSVSVSVWECMRARLCEPNYETIVTTTPTNTR